MEKIVSNISPYIIPGLKGRCIVKFKSYEERVLESFCAINRCTLDQVKGKRRFKELVAVRQAFSLWAKNNTKLTFKNLGNILKKDHATIIHSYKTAKNRLDSNDDLFMLVNNKCLSTLTK